jgi:intracellular sulfur oxidation DsrE/DsrF family protein
VIVIKNKAMTARRSFLARLGAAAAAFGFGSSAADAQAPAPPASPPAAAALLPETRWQPAREAKDDWLDQIPGKHRLVFDSVSPEGASGAIQFANNFYTGNKNGYELEPADVAVVIVLRHRATQFAFTDAIWAKYGAALSESDKFVDPKTSAAPNVNVYRNGLEAHVKRGVHFAVCDLSTHRLANFIARKSEANADAVYKELTSNAFPNAHFVAAGILAVNRAQERGYAVSHAG